MIRHFANPIRDVDTVGIQLMYSILEDKAEAFRLKPDLPEVDDTRAQVLKIVALDIGSFKRFVISHIWG